MRERPLERPASVLQKASVMSKARPRDGVRYFPLGISWASPRWAGHVSAFVVTVYTDVVCSRKCIRSSPAPGSDGDG